MNKIFLILILLINLETVNSQTAQIRINIKNSPKTRLQETGVNINNPVFENENEIICNLNQSDLFLLDISKIEFDIIIDDIEKQIEINNQTDTIIPSKKQLRFLSENYNYNTNFTTLKYDKEGFYILIHKTQEGIPVRKKVIVIK